MVTTRDLMLRWTVYGAATLLFAALQTLLLRHLGYGGAFPFIFPMLAAVAASFEGPLQGVLYGMVLGVLCDLSIAAPLPCLYTLSFAAAALLAAFVAEVLIHPGFLCSLTVSAAAYLVCDLIVAAVFFMKYRTAVLDLAPTAGWEALLSLPCLLVVYPVFSRIHRKFSV